MWHELKSVTLLPLNPSFLSWSRLVDCRCENILFEPACNKVVTVQQNTSHELKSHILCKNMWSLFSKFHILFAFSGVLLGDHCDRISYPHFAVRWSCRRSSGSTVYCQNCNSNLSAKFQITQLPICLILSCQVFWTTRSIHLWHHSDDIGHMILKFDSRVMFLPPAPPLHYYVSVDISVFCFH